MNRYAVFGLRSVVCGLRSAVYNPDLFGQDLAGVLRQSGWVEAEVTAPQVTVWTFGQDLTAASRPAVVALEVDETGRPGRYEDDLFVPNVEPSGRVLVAGTRVWTSSDFTSQWTTNAPHARRVFAPVAALVSSTAGTTFVFLGYVSTDALGAPAAAPAPAPAPAPRTGPRAGGVQRRGSPLGAGASRFVPPASPARAGAPTSPVSSTRPAGAPFDVGASLVVVKRTPLYSGPVPFASPVVSTHPELVPGERVTLTGYVAADPRLASVLLPDGTRGFASVAVLAAAPAPPAPVPPPAVEQPPAPSDQLPAGGAPIPPPAGQASAGQASTEQAPQVLARPQGFVPGSETVALSRATGQAAGAALSPFVNEALTLGAIALGVGAGALVIYGLTREGKR